MTIAIVLEHLDPSRGGAETSATQLARELSRLGHDVTLVVRRDTLSVAAAGQLVGDREAGVRIEALEPAGLSRAARTGAFLRAAARVCRPGRFDIVHSLLPLEGCDVYQPRGGTYAATIHHSTLMLPEPWRSLRRGVKRLNRRQQRLAALERALLTGDDVPHVACVSNFVRRQVLELAPELPPERVVVIRNGVSIEPLAGEAARAARLVWRRRLGVAETTPLLLFCAHNLRLKGFAELKAALRHPKADERWHVLVAGGRGNGNGDGGGDEGQPPPAGDASDGGQSPPAGQTNIGGQPPPAGQIPVASDLRVRRGVGQGRPTLRQDDLSESTTGKGQPSGAGSDRIHLLGPQRDMPALYAAADALVHPTWYDPCSRVVLEALCCGLPVVTTAFDGAAEVVEDGRDGRVIERPDDPEALCAAIGGVLDPAVRRYAASRAGQRREALSMRRHAEALLELYRSIVPARC